MAERVEPRTLQGTMELLPPDQILFNRMYDTIRGVYESFGFLPLDTPVLEYASVLLAKAGGETEKQIYRFNKGDSDLTMRFDLTVPLAKYVAKNYSELTFPFRRYQIGKVYRGERAQKGRFREFYQADIDIVGDGSLSIVNDAEIPSIIYNLFNNLGIDNFVIRINNRKVLNGLFDNFGVKESAVDILRIIDKIDKIGRDNVAKELVELKVPEATVSQLLDVLTLDGSNEDKVEKLKGFAGCNEVFDAGLSELTTVIDYIAGFGVPSDYYKIDLSIARGLDYYTGTVYETFIKNHPEYGSVCSGGRYDNLAEYYTKKSLPGVGISIGLTRLFYVLCENNFLNRELECPVDALVVPMTDDMTYAVRTATGLRAADINTQIYLEGGKFKKKLTYGSRLTIPFCIILGTDEIDTNQVTIKNMNTGEQKTTDLQEAISIINNQKELLNKAQYVNMQ